MADKCKPCPSLRCGRWVIIHDVNCIKIDCNMLSHEFGACGDDDRSDLRRLIVNFGAQFRSSPKTAAQ